MKYVLKTAMWIGIAAGMLMGVFSCKQERLLFYPDKLPKDYKFSFHNRFKEYSITVDDSTKLNGLLFQCDHSKGLIFYLHGNGGCVDSWGGIADVYLKNNYDLFILDYRGYGKSDGGISSEKELYNDIQIAYDTMRNSYNQQDIVIIGYSIGTGLAAKLASTNTPKMLILKAPYYNMPDLAHQYMKLLPSLFIRYKLKTNEYIQDVKCPITIFHGDEDEVIYAGSSYKLQKYFKPNDRLIILKGQKHNGINENAIYKRELKRLLE